MTAEMAMTSAALFTMAPDIIPLVYNITEIHIAAFLETFPEAIGRYGLFMRSDSTSYISLTLLAAAVINTPLMHANMIAYTGSIFPARKAPIKIEIPPIAAL